MAQAPTALVLLAAGSEEMETIITVDVLRRAGVDVTLAGVDGPDPVRCSRQVVVSPDASLAEVGTDYDVLALPGGMGGATRFAEAEQVGRRLRGQADAGRLVAAICAAPMALARHDVLAGRSMTCHPSVKEIVAAHGKHVDEPVAEDGNLITSQGPGTAFLFALTLVRRLLGDDKAAEVRAPMRMPG